MTQTTPEQIDAMRALCDRIQKSPIKSAYVDDWGRFGNFTVFVRPEVHTRSTTATLKALVKKALPDNAHLRECFPPQAIYQKERFRKKSAKVGYNRNFWIFDIDFQNYDPLTNTFETS